MRFERLSIANVRNLSQVQIELIDGLNVFVGGNGAGKTSILEAAHLLARGRSFRTTRVGSVIHRGHDSLVVQADVRDEHRGVLSIGLHKRRDNVAEARINGIPQRQQSEVAALLPIQLLLADGAELVLGGPADRRGFLDWGLFHVEPTALRTLREYQRALRQRSVLLRGARGHEEPPPPEIATWSERLAEIGEVVDQLRAAYVTELSRLFADQLGCIAPGLGVQLDYLRGWSASQSLLKSLKESLARDVKFGATHAGPHRAELRIRTNDQAAADVLSRGQAKVVATALRLAQAQHTMTVAGRRSVFLLDDVGAELDREHSRRFFGALEAMGCQVLAAANSAPSDDLGFAGRRRMFHVEHGRCRPAIDSNRNDRRNDS